MDANATTPLLPEVFEAMRPFFLEHYGNASSIHQQGQFARAAVDHARDQIAHLLHCRTSEIVFTSGGTESDNLALFGTLSGTLHTLKTSPLTSSPPASSTTPSSAPPNPSRKTTSKSPSFQALHRESSTQQRSSPQSVPTRS